MANPVNSWLRFLLAAALLAGAGLYLAARERVEVLPARQTLAFFPLRVGNWWGRDVTLPEKIIEALGPGEFLERTYSRASDEPPIDLFLAYFPSQRTGDTIHTPKNCLPGAGWAPLVVSRIVLERPGGSPVIVNRYVIGKGADRLLVLYWYQAHGRVVASEYWAKFYLVADAIRLNRTDGALVRVITPIPTSREEAKAEERAVEFARSVFPTLESYIPQ